jgi:hypothetical protein
VHDLGVFWSFWRLTADPSEKQLFTAHPLTAV